MGLSTSELERIAQHDSDPNVRISAVRRLSPNESRSELERIAQHDSDPRVRMAAIEQLKPTGHSVGSISVYCAWCGAIPGGISTCPLGRNGVHNFVEGGAPVYCAWCGAVPSQPTRCPLGRAGVHNFKAR